jgi:hypothetical protein
MEISLEKKERRLLPTCLDHTRNLTPKGEFPEADPAHPETTQERARAATDLAPIALAHLELLGPAGPHDLRRLRHR